MIEDAGGTLAAGLTGFVAPLEGIAAFLEVVLPLVQKVFDELTVFGLEWMDSVVKWDAIAWGRQSCIEGALGFFW